MQAGVDGGYLQTLRSVLDACICPNLGQHGVHVEEVGIWESVSVVVTVEAHQPVGREIPYEPRKEAIEGAYPVEIDFALLYVS